MELVKTEHNLGARSLVVLFFVCFCRVSFIRSTYKEKNIRKDLPFFGLVQSKWILQNRVRPPVFHLAVCSQISADLTQYFFPDILHDFRRPWMLKSEGARFYDKICFCPVLNESGLIWLKNKFFWKHHQFCSEWINPISVRIQGMA